MRFQIYSEVKVFYNDTYDALMRHEAQNLIPLGNVIIGSAGSDKSGWRDPSGWFMAAVSDETGVRLTAVMTPPHYLTLYDTDNTPDGGALSCLIQGIVAAGIHIPGVMTEASLAKRFAEEYSRETGNGYAVRKNQRIYELTRVNPEIPAVGSIRPARESDMAFLPYWLAGFDRDCFGDRAADWDDMAGRARYQIAGGRLYILEDGGAPVSMANRSREMRTACGVSYVYTPPYFRNRGYASACVAAVSRLCLERGFKRCVLYTDLANPVSNSIYRKIGYEAICDSTEIGFE
ncbi:MAG: GNAT family N-acetyltransferase [Defluviitaleaceae bacterium]|nr:GNAT family N-acetyltransferase [Defluviitaleaceae bacterium]